MQKKVITIFLIIICCISSFISYGEELPNIFDHKCGIWEIPSPSKEKRWLIIHNLEEAKQTGVFHIEIIARENNKPKWQIKHICNHMAITLSALEKSIVRPLKTGAVYPESFNTAYAEWKKKAEQGEKVICNTSVMDCLPNK